MNEWIKKNKNDSRVLAWRIEELPFTERRNPVGEAIWEYKENKEFNSVKSETPYKNLKGDIK